MVAQRVHSCAFSGRGFLAAATKVSLCFARLIFTVLAQLRIRCVGRCHPIPLSLAAMFIGSAIYRSISAIAGVLSIAQIGYMTLASLWPMSRA